MSRNRRTNALPVVKSGLAQRQVAVEIRPAGGKVVLRIAIDLPFGSRYHLQRRRKAGDSQVITTCRTEQRFRLRRPRRRRHDQRAGVHGGHRSHQGGQRAQNKHTAGEREQFPNQLLDGFGENLSDRALRHAGDRLLGDGAGQHRGHRRHPLGHRCPGAATGKRFYRVVVW